MHVHGRQRAYRTMAGPPVIDRRVWFDDDALWVVLDTVRAPGKHTIRQTWQFNVTGAQLGGMRAVAGRPDGAQVVIAVAEAPHQTLAIEKSVVSPIYGSKHAADRLVVERPAANARIAAAILAVPPDAAHPQLSVELTERANGNGCVLNVVSGSKTVRINADGHKWSVQTLD
jgi:hypothetical protein